MPLRPHNIDMSTYKRPRFPPEIISYAVLLYLRFNLSHRDIEDILAQRGINVSYESVRCWCLKFGPKYAKRLRKKHRGFGDTFFVDEVFIRIGGKQHYLWRAVDQSGVCSYSQPVDSDIKQFKETPGGFLNSMSKVVLCYSMGQM